MVRRIRAYAFANEMGRGGVLMVAAAAFANSSAASLLGMPLRPGTQIMMGLSCCPVAGENTGCHTRHSEKNF